MVIVFTTSTARVTLSTVHRQGYLTLTMYLQYKQTVVLWRIFSTK